jgi:DNA-binding HxlR family transcriptional regulator
MKLLKTSPALFNAYRILILKTLYLHGVADFRELKYGLEITNGNLASHLRALEQVNLIEENKQIVGRRPRTTYKLTLEGSNEFKKFKDSMLTVVK